MSLVPAFELGLWNGWILVLTFFGLIIPLWVIERLKGWKSSSRPDTPSHSLNDKEKKLSKVSMVISFALYIYPIFLPLKLGTAWLYVGLFVYLFGWIFSFVAALNLASTPADKVATKGLYRISRHPFYLGMTLTFTGIGIACASWLYMLLGTPNLIIANIYLDAEERWCLERYGDAYREYMNRTPRWIGIPKSKNKVLNI